MAPYFKINNVSVKNVHSKCITTVHLRFCQMNEILDAEEDFIEKIISYCQETTPELLQNKFESENPLELCENCRLKDKLLGLVACAFQHYKKTVIIPEAFQKALDYATAGANEEDDINISLFQPDIGVTRLPAQKRNEISAVALISAIEEVKTLSLDNEYIIKASHNVCSI